MTGRVNVDVMWVAVFPIRFAAMRTRVARASLSVDIRNSNRTSNGIVAVPSSTKKQAISRLITGVAGAAKRSDAGTACVGI